MASLQTTLTTHMTAAQPVNITTQTGRFINVVITDDGSVGDSIVVTDQSGNETIIPKAMIGSLPVAARPAPTP